MKIIDKTIRKLSYYQDKLEEQKIENLIIKAHVSDYDFMPIKNAYLRRILNYAYNHCSYYKKLFDENKINLNDDNCYKSIPFLTRNILRENKANIASNRSKWIYHYHEKTSGTTGDPLKITLSYKTKEIDHILFSYYAHLMGYKKGDVIISLGAGPLPDEKIAEEIFWKDVGNINDLPYGRLNFSRLYYNKNTASLFAKKIRELQPAIIRGLPSFICEAADELSFLKNKLKAIMLTAETILPGQLEKLKEIFCCNIYLQYGHTELAMFNYTIDDSYKYFCSPLMGWIEILDKYGNHVKVGETGEVVATGFHNNIMPFIRYRTGDLAQYLGEENGFVILSRIEGRIQDLLIDRNGNKTTLYDFYRNTDSSDKVEAFQMHQYEAGNLIVKIVPLEELTEYDKSQFIDLLNKGNFDATIEIVDDIPLTSGGKRKWIVQHMEGV
jgi:phenylacetate-CoA ligase